MLLAACTSSSSDEGEQAESCAYQVHFQNRTYTDVANVKFTAGKELGSATIPPCRDTGDQGQAEEPEEKTTAYAVDGISPDLAVAVGDNRNDTTFVAAYSGDKLPPEIQKLIDGS